MKKWLKYIFIMTFMFIGMSNVKAVSKVWSCQNGKTSSFDSNAYDGAVYPYSIRKYKDSVSDSLSYFKDNDKNDDFYIYYYNSIAVSGKSNLYYTKLTELVKSGEDTVYFGDPNDQTYMSFLDNFANTDLSHGMDTFEGFFPILIVSDGGKAQVQFVNAGWTANSVNINDIKNNLKDWSKLPNYTSKIMTMYTDPNGGNFIKGYEDMTNIKIDDKGCENALDDAGEDISKRGEEDQNAGYDTSGKRKTDASLTCDNIGETLTIIKQIYTFIKYLIPILIIGLSILDFAKVILNGEEKVFKEAWTKFVKRLGIGIIIILLPIILSMVLKASGALESYGVSSDNYFCIFE